jgi:hypothetical protein
VRGRGGGAGIFLARWVGCSAWGCAEADSRRGRRKVGVCGRSQRLSSSISSARDAKLRLRRNFSERLHATEFDRSWRDVVFVPRSTLHLMMTGRFGLGATGGRAEALGECSPLPLRAGRSNGDDESGAPRDGNGALARRCGGALAAMGLVRLL